MTQSIFITASNPFGFPVGSMQSVSDAVALQALGDVTQQGGWGRLSQTVTQLPDTPQQLANGALTPAQATAVAPLILTTGTAAASANSAAILAALKANAGPISIIQPGLYYINRTIEPRSHQRIYTAPGVELHLAAGSNCNMLRNYYAQNAIDRLNVSIASNVATFTENGHNRLAGDQVYIEGCQGNTGINGLQTIASVSGNNWTIAAASNTALTNDLYHRVFIARAYQLPAANFSRTSNVVTVTEAGHTRQPGDHVYIAGLATDTSFNGMAEITTVVRGTSWAYASTGSNGSPTGAANVLGDTDIDLDIACLNYDAANNNSDSLGATCITLGNIGNCRVRMPAMIDGASRAAQIFNAGYSDFPIMWAYKGKGTTQFESNCNEITVGDVRGFSITDDALAWGVTGQITPFGDTASPSGQGSMGTLRVGVVNGTPATALLKLFAYTGYDAGRVKILELAGSQQTIIGDATTAGGGGTLTELTIDDFAPTPPLNQPALWFQSGGFSTIGKVNIGRFVDLPASPATTGYGIWFNQAVGAISIDNLESKAQRTAAPLFLIASAVTSISIGRLFTSTGVGTSNQTFLLAAGGVVGLVQIGRWNHVGSGVTASAACQEQGGGYASILQVGQLQVTNCVAFYQCVDTNSQTHNIELGNVYMDTLNQGFGGGTGGTYNIQVGTLQATNLSNNLLQWYQNSPTVNFSCANLSHPAGQGCLFSGTTFMHLNSMGMKIDMGANAGSPPSELTPSAGDLLWNTNATGTGLYGRTAAGAWTKVF